MYYFPSALRDLNFADSVNPELKYTFNSGKSALRCVLKTLKLASGSKVAIPAYVCKDVKNSVDAELLAPVLFDLKNDKTFWTDYDLTRIMNENIKAIILVHLHGFIHPDTVRITEFCATNNIFLVHDAAQSYGIDEAQLTQSNGIVYSFGPGKSVTAAGGGWAKNISDDDYSKYTKSDPAFGFHNAKAIFFAKSRIYGNRFSKRDTLMNTVRNGISRSSSDIFKMAPFQKKAASFILSDLKEIIPLRKKRYRSIKEKVEQNKKLQIAYDDDKGGYFKIVLFIEGSAKDFNNYLQEHNIPHFYLFKPDNVVPGAKTGLPNFNKWAQHFVELSTEASIPEAEIERVATIVSAY